MNASEKTRADADEGVVLGREVYVDESGGHGHCWCNRSVPVDVAVEIECEIIDGGNETCDDYTASNGCHYRW
jgi:hypothetical protein